MIGDRVRERVPRRKALQEVDRRTVALFATLAPELRNPPRRSATALHLLNMAGGAAHAERVSEMLDRQVNHMVRLVNDLMEASRISAASWH